MSKKPVNAREVQSFLNALADVGSNELYSWALGLFAQGYSVDSVRRELGILMEKSGRQT